MFWLTVPTKYTRHSPYTNKQSYPRSKCQLWCILSTPMTHWWVSFADQGNDYPPPEAARKHIQQSDRSVKFVPRSNCQEAIASSQEALSFLPSNELQYKVSERKSYQKCLRCGLRPLFLKFCSPKACFLDISGYLWRQMPSKTFWKLQGVQNTSCLHHGLLNLLFLSPERHEMGVKYIFWSKSQMLRTRIYPILLLSSQKI